MQQIDERSLVAAAKPGLSCSIRRSSTPRRRRICSTTISRRWPPVRPQHRCDARSGARRGRRLDLALDGCVPKPRTWTIAELKRGFEPVTRCSDRMRRQRPRVFSRNRPGPCCGNTAQSVACAGPACGSAICCECGPLPRRSTPAITALILSRQRGPAISRGLPIEKALFAGNARRLRDQRRADASAARRPVAARGAGLSRLVLSEMARRASRSRPRARWRTDDGPHYACRARRSVTASHRRSAVEVIADMPVNSLITSPRDGFRAGRRSAAIRGHAWSGHTPVARVELSFDGGRSWRAARLAPAADRFAWRRFEVHA